MKKSLVALGLITMPLSVFAAPGDFGPKMGDSEFTLSGTGASNNEFDRGTIGVAASYGKYISDNVEWAVRQGINYADFGNSSWNGSTRLAVDYHFNAGQWRPLVGLQVGMVYGDDVSDSGIIGPEVGIKYYAKPDTFIYFLEEYQYFFNNSSDITDNFKDGAFVHTVGIGFNF